MTDPPPLGASPTDTAGSSEERARLARIYERLAEGTGYLRHAYLEQMARVSRILYAMSGVVVASVAIPLFSFAFESRSWLAGLLGLLLVAVGALIVSRTRRVSRRVGDSVLERLTLPTAPPKLDPSMGELLAVMETAVRALPELRKKVTRVVVGLTLLALAAVGVVAGVLTAISAAGYDPFYLIFGELAVFALVAPFALREEAASETAERELKLMAADLDELKSTFLSKFPGEPSG